MPSSLEEHSESVFQDTFHVLFSGLPDKARTKDTLGPLFSSRVNLAMKARQDGAWKFAEEFYKLDDMSRLLMIIKYVTHFQDLLEATQKAAELGDDWQTYTGDTRAEYHNAGRELAGLLVRHCKPFLIKRVLNRGEFLRICPFLSYTLSPIVALKYAIGTKAAYDLRSTCPSALVYLALESASTNPTPDTLVCVAEYMRLAAKTQIGFNASRRGYDAEYISLTGDMQLFSASLEDADPDWDTFKTEQFRKYLKSKTGLRTPQSRHWVSAFLRVMICRTAESTLNRINQVFTREVPRNKVIFYLDITRYSEYFPVEGFDDDTLCNFPSNVVILFKRVKRPYALQTSSLSASVEGVVSQLKAFRLNNLPKEKLVAHYDAYSIAVFNELQRLRRAAGLVLVVMSPPDIHAELSLRTI